MITRIEIDGFKSFHNFAVNLRPFQVLIGANGVGKSNLFDAIVLLSNLAGDNTLYEAFGSNRGDISELFTRYPDGRRATIMTFAVEMLIAKDITDEPGVTSDVSSTRLRYEVQLESRAENGFERLYVTHESLTPIPSDTDQWQQLISSSQHNQWIIRDRRDPYIATEGNTITQYPDGQTGPQFKLTFTPRSLERTILSTIYYPPTHPTAYAARQEMRNWQFLQFNPMELRKPSSRFVGFRHPRLLPDGSNLAAVLYRLQNEDEFALTDISRDMANIVPGILDISVETLREREELLIEATNTDGTHFSSRILSDGTLRLLALVALKYDPWHRGVLCFEEPENGVHPERLQSIVDVLKSLATDFDDPDDDAPPRQVLLNTHSPKLMACVDVDDLLYVHIVRQHTRMSPISGEALPDETSEQEERFSMIQVERMLDPEPQARKRGIIQERTAKL